MLNKKIIKSTPLTDRIVTLLGGSGLIWLLDQFIKIQNDINIFIK